MGAILDSFSQATRISASEVSWSDLSDTTADVMGNSPQAPKQPIASGRSAISARFESLVRSVEKREGEPRSFEVIE